MNVIDNSELKKRVDILRKNIKENNLDGIIVYSDEYRSGYCTYFTGYKPINVIEESPQTLILMENEDPILVIGRLNYYSAKETVWIKTILQHHKFDSEISEVAELNNERIKNKIQFLQKEYVTQMFRDQKKIKQYIQNQLKKLIY